MLKQKIQNYFRIFGTVLIGIVLTSILFAAMPSVTFAQAENQDMDGQATAEDYWGSNASTRNFKVTDYLKVEKQNQSYLKDKVPIATFIVKVINFITLTIGSLSLLAIIVGGFLLVTSHGAENQLTKGKEVIKFAVIGLIVTFSAYFIVAFVQSLLYEI